MAASPRKGGQADNTHRLQDPRHWRTVTGTVKQQHADDNKSVAHQRTTPSNSLIPRAKFAVQLSQQKQNTYNSLQTRSVNRTWQGDIPVRGSESTSSLDCLQTFDMDSDTSQGLRTRLKSALKSSSNHGFKPYSNEQSMNTQESKKWQTKDLVRLRDNVQRTLEDWSDNTDIDRLQGKREPTRYSQRNLNEFYPYPNPRQGEKLRMEDSNLPPRNSNVVDLEEKPDRSSNVPDKTNQPPGKSRMLPTVEKTTQGSQEQLPRNVDLQQKLRDFKTGKNLNSLRTFLKGLPGRPSPVPDGRNSVDSAFYDHSREEENKQLASHGMPINDSSGRTRKDSLSSIGSTATGKVSPISRRWGVAVDTVRDRRQKTAESTRKKMAELDQLKKNAEDSHVRANRMEAEIEPLREKVKRYEEVIENLEDRMEQYKNDMLSKEREKLLEIDKLERRHRTDIDKEKHDKEDLEMQLKDEVRRGQSEIKQLRKQLDELTDELESCRESSKIDEDSHPKTKQLSSMRKELMQVRQLLEDSETERLSERKGKLSTIQNMIKLTKQKADIEEELDDKKKADTKESSDKYMKLTAKLAVTEMKLQKLRQEKGQEIEELQGKFLEEIRELKKSKESQLSAIAKERDDLKKQLDTDNTDYRPPSTPSTPRTPDAKSVGDKGVQWKEISKYLEEQGVKSGTYTTDEAAKQLFIRLKNESEKAKQLQDIIKQSKNGDLRSVVEELREEKRTTRRKLEDLQETVATKDSQMKVTEMALKRQIEDLLGEKKGAFLQMQKAIDLADNAKEDADKYKSELDDVKALLQKKQTEMNMLQDNLLSVTNEMKTVDADLGKTKKELSVKEAELARVKRDIDIEMGLVSQEKDASNRVRTELEQKRMIIKGCEKTIHELEDRVHVLNETVESHRLQSERLNTEREKMSEELQATRSEVVEYRTRGKESEEVVKNLKTQVKSLENNLREKIDRLSTISIEFEKTKTELLASQHLLSEEQDKNQSLEDEIDGISDELKHKTEETERLNAKVNDLEDELENIKVELSQTQVSFADTEDSLKSQYSTRSLIEKELRLLQGQYKDLTREKQNIQNAFEDTKQQLQSISSVKKQLQEDLQDVKWKLNEKILAVNEMKADKERTTESLEKLESDLRIAEDKLVVFKRDKQTLTEENDRLKDHVSDLKRTNGQLSEQIRRKKEESDKHGKYSSQRVDFLTRENEELRSQIRNAQSILQEFPELDFFENDETDSGISTNNYLAAPVGALIEKLKSSERNLRDKEIEFRQLQDKAASLNAEVTRLSDQSMKEKSSLRQECDRKVRESEDECVLLKQKHQQAVQTLEQNLRKEERTRKEIERQLTDLERQKELLNDGHDTAKQQLETSKRSESSLQSQIAKLEEQLMGAKQSESQVVKQLREENKMTKDTLMKNQEELSRLKNEFGEKRETLILTLREKDDQVRELEMLSKSGEEDKARLAQQLKERDREWQTQMEKLSKAQEDYQNLYRESASNRLKYENDVNALEEAIREKEAVIGDTKRELEKRDLTVSEIQGKLNRVEKELQATVDHRGTVDKEISVHRQKLMDESMQFHEKLASLENQNRALQENLAAIQQARSMEVPQYQMSSPINSSLANIELDNLKKQLEHDRMEWTRERKEKREALKCIKALVYDNEALAKCISGLQDTVSQQREEVAEAAVHLKDVLEKYEHEKQVSLSGQRMFETMMQDKSRQEDERASQLKGENELLKKSLNEFRTEKDKLQWQLEEKSKELERTRGELDYSQRISNNHLLHKRNDGFLENQLAYLTSDRNLLSKQMHTLELSNRMLQDKLRETQRWYGSLGTSLLQPRNASPMTLKGLKENQMKHDQFLQSQFELLATKMANSPSLHMSP